MFRICVVGVLMLLTAVFFIACGSDEPADSSGSQSKSAGKTGVLNQDHPRSEAELRASLEEARSRIRASQLELEKSLATVQAALDQLDGGAMVSLSQVQTPVKTDSPVQTDNTGEEADEGWSWWSKTFLVILIVGGFFAIYRHLIREEGDEEDDFMDDEFLEENELGTVRYPGSGGGRGKGDG